MSSSLPWVERTALARQVWMAPVFIGFVIVLIGMFLDVKMSTAPTEAERSK